MVLSLGTISRPVGVPLANLFESQLQGPEGEPERVYQCCLRAGTQLENLATRKGWNTGKNWYTLSGQSDPKFWSKLRNSGCFVILTIRAII